MIEWYHLILAVLGSQLLTETIRAIYRRRKTQAETQGILINNRVKVENYYEKVAREQDKKIKKQNERINELHKDHEECKEKLKKLETAVKELETERRAKT